jgi:hypothetical protein
MQALDKGSSEDEQANGQPHHAHDEDGSARQLDALRVVVPVLSPMPSARGVSGAEPAEDGQQASINPPPWTCRRIRSSWENADPAHAVGRREVAVRSWSSG